MDMNWKLLVLVLIFVLLTSVVWVPGIVSAAEGHPERFEIYIKTLEFGLRGLYEYFQFLIRAMLEFLKA